MRKRKRHEKTCLKVLTHLFWKLQKGYRQNAQSQIRCHTMWHLIWVSTILQVVRPLSNEYISINLTFTHLTEHGLFGNIYGSRVYSVRKVLNEPMMRKRDSIGRTHGAPYRGYGYVPLRFGGGGDVVRRMGTQQQQTR